VVSYLETSSKNKIPIVNTSTAETIVMAKDGTSILIGGLSRDEKNLNQEGTPFLSRIPLLGEAFKSKTRDSTRTELMILITPHIINGDELTTGYPRDFEVQMDKEYQGYKGFTDDPAKLDYKNYRAYQGAGDKTENLPDLKPARAF
jgi:type II secretory pathway component GspD/PulD (secretin)